MTAHAGTQGYQPGVAVGRAPDYEELIAKERAAKMGFPVETVDAGGPGVGPRRISNPTVARAALAFLAKQVDEDGVTVEKHFLDAGMLFEPAILENVLCGPFPVKDNDPPENPNDEVRILYWWGNSNLYWPLTMAQWEQALADIHTCDDPTFNCSVNPLILPHTHVNDCPGNTTYAQDFHDSPVQPSGVVLPPIYPRPSEVEIYTRMWDMPEYRKVSPGEHVAQIFLEQATPKPGSKVLDLGCGTGRGGFMLAVLGSMDVTLVDFTPNSIDADILPSLDTQSHVLRFVQADLTKPLPVFAEYGFCTDVMEHIPPDDVENVLKNCLRACQHVFFQIATEDDVMGALIGHPLHLSVHPFAWWLDQLQKLDCVVHWSKEVPGAALFYVTAWQDGHAVVDYGVLNTTEELVKNNVKHNIWYGCEGKRDDGSAINSPITWQQVVPHETNDEEVMVVGGGPSLAEFEDEIRENRKNGMKLVTMNGAYNWCIEHDIGPISATVVVDARAFNARFTHPVIEKTKYLIASQVDPSVLEGLPVDRTYLWHTTADMFRDLLNERYERWYGIPGGSTVLLRTLPLLRVLGFHKFQLFGCDSCLVQAGDQRLDHAYAQPENAPEPIMPVVVGGATYACYGWHVAQAQQFIDLIRFMGHEMVLEIPGKGLLAHILNHGAAEFDKSVFLQ